MVEQVRVCYQAEASCPRLRRAVVGERLLGVDPPLHRQFPLLAWGENSRSARRADGR